MNPIFLGCILGIFLVACAGEANAQMTNDNSRGTLSEKDFKFVKAAAQGGQAEVILGQIAEQNAQDPSVRDFGLKMASDHQAADQELSRIISQKSASVSDESGMMDAHMIKHLQNLKGADFDTAYIKHMVRDHKQTIREFQKEADNGDDADLRNFASKTLPTLQEHLRQAQDVESKLSSSALK